MIIDVLRIFFPFVGKESTLFVVIIDNTLSLDWRVIDELHQTTISISRCLSKKLALIPETKLVITNNVSPMRGKEKHFKGNS